MPTAPKPAAWAAENAEAFKQESLARAYHMRPGYPDTFYETLSGLINDRPRTVLDLGCGIGDMARRLTGFADRVDALDASPAMINRARELEAGDHQKITWIQGRAEDVVVNPPYALVVASDSLHWMDWEVILPRIKEVLSPNGWLAIAERVWGTGTVEERQLLARYSENKAFRPLNLIEELESRGLFRKAGGWGFSVAWRPTIDEYLGARRTQASYPADPGRAREFDRETEELLRWLVNEGRLQSSRDRLELAVQGGVGWGRPLPAPD